MPSATNHKTGIPLPLFRFRITPAEQKIGTMSQTTAEGSKTGPRRFRFTLRMMFVVTTAVALSIGLVIRYSSCAGIFMSSMVLCFAYCYLRQRKKGMIAYGAALAAFWVALQLIGPYNSLRNRVVWVIGTERLQQWAVATLDNPPPADEYGDIRLDRTKLPEDIRSIAGRYPKIVAAENATEEYVSFSHGGGFYGWGIKVGRPGFVPSSSTSFRYEKLADGVWGFYEL